MQSVIMLSAILWSVVLMSVIIRSVVMLSVVAPPARYALSQDYRYLGTVLGLPTVATSVKLASL
jgi:hypothetical protein